MAKNKLKYYMNKAGYKSDMLYYNNGDEARRQKFPDGGLMTPAPLFMFMAERQKTVILCE